MGPEKSYENKIKSYLSMKDAWQLKTWGGGMQRSGIPDILVCLSGKFIAIEVKSKRGRPDSLQLKELHDIDYAGGYSILAYPNDWDLLKQFIDDIALHGCSDSYYELKMIWYDKYERMMRENDFT